MSMESDGRSCRVTRSSIYDVYINNERRRGLNVYESARRAAVAEVWGDQTTTLIRVFHGSYGYQKIPFEIAMKAFKHKMDSDCHKYIVEYLSNDDCKSRTLGPKEAVEWLIKGDFYFILSHAHQGNPQWNCQDLQNAYQGMLCRRFGFPGRLQLRCPVFSQVDDRCFTFEISTAF